VLGAVKPLEVEINCPAATSKENQFVCIRLRTDRSMFAATDLCRASCFASFRQHRSMGGAGRYTCGQIVMMFGGFRIVMGQNTRGDTDPFRRLQGDRRRGAVPEAVGRHRKPQDVRSALPDEVGNAAAGKPFAVLGQPERSVIPGQSLAALEQRQYTVPLRRTGP
jgi:hypothetical protein